MDFKGLKKYLFFRSFPPIQPDCSICYYEPSHFYRNFSFYPGDQRILWLPSKFKQITFTFISRLLLSLNLKIIYIIFVVITPLECLMICHYAISRGRGRGGYSSSNIWLKLSRWGFENLTLFRTIKKTPKIHTLFRAATPLNILTSQYRQYKGVHSPPSPSAHFPPVMSSMNLTKKKKTF